MSGVYRPNVAAIIVNDEDKILICERCLNPGAWQFPQGGIDDGEHAGQALERELEEETGFVSADYDVLDSKGTYRYLFANDRGVELPREKHGRTYVGQEQTYYLCRLRPDAPAPNLDQREFGCCRWIRPEEFRLEWLPVFKRGVYRAVFKDFFEIDLVD